VLAKYRAGEKPGNALRTLATIPELVDGTMPFQEYIANRSSLSPRHRELLILRTAWLLNNDQIWGEHAAAAQRAGLTAGEIHRVAEGPRVQS
jgi:alkylhydroperoxidase/carboxymuconolactone decarboxylase family protein YurZ